MSEPFVHSLRVRYGECDPQGIVFNANYVLYFDVAFTELWRARIGPWMDMTKHGFDAVVAEINVRFHASARFDDELDLVCRVVGLGTTSITTEIDCMRGDELLVKGTLRHVCVDAESFQKTPLPEFVREALAA